MKRGAFIRSLIALPTLAKIAPKLIRPETNGGLLKAMVDGKVIDEYHLYPSAISFKPIKDLRESIELVEFSAVLVPANEHTRCIDCEVAPVDQLSKETGADGKLLRDGR